MLTKKLLMIITTILLSTFCFIAVLSSKTIIEDNRQALLQTDRDFSKLSASKGTVEAFSTYMADNAVVYRNNQKPFKGRTALIDLFKREEGGQLTWEPFFADADQNGNLGYTLGEWHYITTDSEGVEIKSNGYYVSIWKKQSDGSWKYVFDSGISGPKE